MAGGLEGVPPEYQNVITFLGLIGAAILVAWRYATGFLKPPAAPPEVQVVGGALADRGAMERLAESIDRVGDLLEAFMAQQERHHAADDLATVHRRLDDMADLRRALEELSRRIPPS